MESLGPLVNYWEGKVQGEGIVLFVKEQCNGLRKGWQKRLLDNLLQKKAFQSIMRRYNGDGERDDESNSLHAFNYSSELAVQIEYTGSNPISAILLNDGTIGCVVKSCTILPLLHTGEYRRKINCMHYERWILAAESKGFSSDKVVASLLFLPVLREPRIEGMYAVINSVWEERNSDGVFRLPEQLDGKGV